MKTVGFGDHDHGACIKDGVDAAIEATQARGLRFTPVRQRVLEILLSRHRAMGAYEVLDILRDEGLGSQPPVVYRALSFLVDNDLAHKIEHLNAFTACTQTGVGHTPVFLICDDCGTVVETAVPEAERSLSQAAADAGFQIRTTVVEASGQCPECRAGTSGQS